MRKQKTIDEDWRYLKRKWSRQFKAIIRGSVDRLIKDLKGKKLIVYGGGAMAGILLKSLKKLGIKGYNYSDSESEELECRVLIASVFQYEIMQKFAKAGRKISVINAMTDVNDVYRKFREKKGES